MSIRLLDGERVLAHIKCDLEDMRSLSVHIWQAADAFEKQQLAALPVKAMGRA